MIKKIQGILFFLIFLKNRDCGHTQGRIGVLINEYRNLLNVTT